MVRPPVGCERLALRVVDRPGATGSIGRPPFVGPAVMRVGLFPSGLSVQASGIGGGGGFQPRLLWGRLRL